MTELVRPALYGSRHDILPLRQAAVSGEAPMATSVEGPVCELTDSFGTHQLPRLRRGDLVAIEGAGAYAGSFTSRYNGRPQPCEVLYWPDGPLQLSERPLPSPRPRLSATVGANEDAGSRAGRGH